MTPVRCSLRARPPDRPVWVCIRIALMSVNSALAASVSHASVDSQCSHATVLVTLRVKHPCHPPQPYTASTYSLFHACVQLSVLQLSGQCGPIRTVSIPRLCCFRQQQGDHRCCWCCTSLLLQPTCCPIRFASAKSLPRYAGMNLLPRIRSSGQPGAHRTFCKWRQCSNPQPCLPRCGL